VETLVRVCVPGPFVGGRGAGPSLVSQILGCGAGLFFGVPGRGPGVASSFFHRNALPHGQGGRGVLGGSMGRRRCGAVLNCVTGFVRLRFFSWVFSPYIFMSFGWALLAGFGRLASLRLEETVACGKRLSLVRIIIDGGMANRAGGGLAASLPPSREFLAPPPTLRSPPTIFCSLALGLGGPRV